MILSTTCDKYVLLFTTKSKRISELSQKRGFYRYIGVIGSADSEYINATRAAEGVKRSGHWLEIL